MALKLVLLAGAGALGTLARYGCAVFVEHRVTHTFPWHTLAINTAGCFLFGLIFEMFFSRIEQQTGWHADARVIVLTGFMGAFTTFSTFAFETNALLRESQYTLAALNVFAQNTLGIVFVILGVLLAKTLM